MPRTKLAKDPVSLRLYEGQIEKIRDLQQRFPMATPRQEAEFIRQIIDIGLIGLTDKDTGLFRWLIAEEAKAAKTNKKTK